MAQQVKDLASLLLWFGLGCCGGMGLIPALGILHAVGAAKKKKKV